MESLVVVVAEMPYTHKEAVGVSTAASNMTMFDRIARQMAAYRGAEKQVYYVADNATPSDLSQIYPSVQRQMSGVGFVPPSVSPNGRPATQLLYTKQLLVNHGVRRVTLAGADEERIIDLYLLLNGREGRYYTTADHLELARLQLDVDEDAFPDLFSKVIPVSLGRDLTTIQGDITDRLRS